MRFKLRTLLPNLPLHGRVAAGLGKRKNHGFVEQWECLHLLDGLFCSCGGVEDDESLAFGFEVLLCDEVDDVSVLGEDGGEGLFQEGDLDGFFEVADLGVLVGGELWGFGVGGAT